MILRKITYFMLFLLSSMIGVRLYYSNVAPKFKIDANTLLTTTDTVITHLNVRQYSALGQLANTVQTPLMRHIPKNNTHWLKTPRITIAQPNQPNWEINAEFATALYGGREITFNKQVRIHQNKGLHNEESTFTTELITYYPKTKLALTSKEILFEQPGNRVQSKGMRANLEKKHIQLLGQTRGMYDPSHG